MTPISLAYYLYGSVEIKIYFQIQTRLQLHLPYENKNYLNDAHIQH